MPFRIRIVLVRCINQTISYKLSKFRLGKQMRSYENRSFPISKRDLLIRRLQIWIDLTGGNQSPSKAVMVC
jgi:hypothetical protein